MSEAINAMPGRVALVGNAPEMAFQGGRIDASDWVVRFNNAAGFGGSAGSRVTHLALVNHGGQMREWLDDPGFVRRPHVSAAGHFLFPFPPKAEPKETQAADGRDWTSAARDLLAPLGAGMTVLADAVQHEAAAIVRTPARPDAVPSTGLLVALHLLSTLPAGASIGVHGFGFAGWEGHHWAAERQWFEAMHDAGRLHLHPLDRTLSA